MVARLIYLSILYTGLKQMIMKERTYLQATEVPVPQQHDQKNKIKDMNQLHFAILDHKDRYYSVEEARPYIDIQLAHVNFSYTDGKKKKFTYAKAKDCEMEDFRDYDQKVYYQSTIDEDEKLICLSK